MLRVGVTGGIGSGKSTVCRILEVLGVPVFRADEEGKALLEGDASIRQAVIDTFGPSLYAAGSLDRKALASIVFNDPGKLARLNAIVHPAVRRRFDAWCAGRSGSPYVVMEAAILAETGGERAMDHLVVVHAPEALRLRRVMARDAASAEEVRSRMRHQTDDATRNAKADTLIANDERALLIPQVLDLHRKLRGDGPADPRLPLSTVTFAFGLLSIPLAFGVQLVSLAVVLAALAILFHLWGRWKARGKNYSGASMRRSRVGWWCGLAGLVAAITMWVLWATNVLLEH